MSDKPYQRAHKYERYQQMISKMVTDRTSHYDVWRDIGDFVSPYRPRFYTTDVNKGTRKNTRIYDVTASLSSRTLRSGMMSGLTPPTRRWFVLTYKEKKIADAPGVKAWLDEVTTIMHTSMSRSNLYQVLPAIYGDMGDFGTACMMAEEDHKNHFHFRDFPIGSYWIMTNSKGFVDVFYHKFTMSARQIIEQFGFEDPTDSQPNWKKLPPEIKAAHDRGSLAERWDVEHMIAPNQDFKVGEKNLKMRRYSSDYWLGASTTMGNVGISGTGGYGSEMKFLREQGHDFFPVLAPRWETTGEDDYGTNCPGIISLGDVKQLQTGEKMSLQAIAKMANPPVKASDALRNVPLQLIGGGVTYLPPEAANATMESVYQINFRIAELEQKQQQVRQRVQRAYFEDLFLMMLMTDRRDITATEVIERKEEKLLALGPVLERLNQDLLDPLIDICFSLLLKQGYIPPAPQEIQGKPLTIEYVSVMAQAQKLAQVSTIERATTFFGQATQVFPAMADKFNVDKVADVYGDVLSLTSGVIRSDEETAQLRAARQQQMEAQMRAEQMQAMSQSAKNLAQSPTEGNNALTALTGGRAV